ncbi:MAG TPA: AAA family ATPase [Acidimicrobiia bacterium]
MTPQPVQTPVQRAPTLTEFLALPEPEYDWIIPGLIERNDRVILTGEEGHGKSTLVRQFGVAPSAGLHPFTLDSIEAIRVLMVDLENSHRQTRRELAKLEPLIRNGDNFGVIVQPALDLTDRNDERWLESHIDANRPDLLLIGPLYKLHDGDPNEEKPAKHVSGVIDRLRTSYGFAVLMEAHTPHAAQGNTRPKRPYGASLWKRWPEFGIHISQYGNLSHWRNPRDDREWPTGLQRGGTWPWEPTKSADQFMPTALMEKVSRLLEGDPAGVSKGGIRDAKLGKHEYVEQAVEYLDRFGYLHVSRTGRSLLHFSVRPYREGDPLEPSDTGQATITDLPEPF